MGRHTPSQHLPNDTIHAIVHGQPELIGIGAVDPALQGQAAALAEAERAVRTLGLAGLDIEPGFGKPARQLVFVRRRQRELHGQGRDGGQES